tara:strand:+ start:563 stop:775 length:213 start_codon:yes stop_codon:yes gene_type:complete
MISKSQEDMISNVQRRVQEIIANKLKADQAIIAEDLAPFEQRLGVDYGGDQPATGKFKDELGIHREEKVG